MVDLKLKTSIANNELRVLVGNEKFNQLTQELCETYENTCQCCGWKPKEETGEDKKQYEYKKRHLTLHVEQLSKENPTFSKTTLLCKSCYVINHIDIGLELGLVELVNARVSQKDLIKICWSDVSKGQVLGQNRYKCYLDKIYIPLKQDPQQLIEKFKNGFSSDTIKVVFTDSFLLK